MKKQQGFTLLEVLVALMILSVTLTAIFYALIEDSRISAHLQEKTFAHWVGKNQISSFKLQLGNNKILTGEQGTTPLFSKQWDWTINIISNNNPYYSELEMEVRPHNSKKIAASLVFYLRKQYE